ncbi:Gfo/Idh/MocA family protein [Paenibacillus ginsengarvi]|uniref:Gfo/Idh/MocA family oxidoreductase n=1 Tax=Paenibacillus ginsengarvi TaxID=400777 RepID=A0A3B0CGM7_9BACL|nr:Gfo/Idh/MocA family oxidoreductase [Paenibacillus ginsengarvi]RKN84683.1 gfo/Idh/MocA family oxidoreductase [Paenibacillus ginsengarvi]
MSYRFAVIGCRHGHIRSFIKEMLDKGHTCAGIYDAEDWKLARQCVELYNVPLVDHVEELLVPSVHIIGSSAVNNEKIDIIEACERGGQHIVLDKPAVTDGDGLRRLEAVMERGRIQIGLMLPKRFWGTMTALKREIDAGAIGDIVHLYITSPHKLLPATRDAWHFSKKRNGGVLIDLLIHDMDVLRWLTGKEIVMTQSVMSKTILPEYPDFYDTAAVQVMMDDGTTAQVHADWHTPATNKDGRFSRIVIAGTEGYAEYGVVYDAKQGKNATYARITRGDGDDPDGTFLKPDAETASAVSDFLDRVDGKQGLFTHVDILAASRATIEADESAVIRNRFDFKH